MGRVRRHLRSCALLWFVFQVATLSAFLPGACCPAHEVAEHADTDCHGQVQDVCPMKATTGEECPMHAGQASGATAPADCVMRALCGAPAGALALLIPVVGVLPDSVVVSDGAVARAVALAPNTTLVTPARLETPPPRIAA